MYIKCADLAPDVHIMARLDLVYVTLSLLEALLPHALHSHFPLSCSSAILHRRALLSAELLPQMCPPQHHLQQ